MLFCDKVSTHPNSNLLGAFIIPMEDGNKYLVRTKSNEHYFATEEEFNNLSKPIR